MIPDKSSIPPNPSSTDTIFFVTMRLRDALPESFVQNLGLQYYSKQIEYAQIPDAAHLLHKTRKRLFAHFDDTLDLCKYGQNYLRESALAGIVYDEIFSFECYYGKLLAFTILPNHVHLLLHFESPVSENLQVDEFDRIHYKPLQDFIERLQNKTEASIQHKLKSMDAQIDPFTFQKRDPKGAIQFEGKFWHDRTFDFYVQDQLELEKINDYILKNPQKAGLTKYWEDWQNTHW